MAFSKTHKMRVEVQKYETYRFEGIECASVQSAVSHVMRNGITQNGDGIFNEGRLKVGESITIRITRTK